MNVNSKSVWKPDLQIINAIDGSSMRTNPNNVVLFAGTQAN